MVKKTKTAVDALHNLMTDAAIGAEDWIKSHSLSTFPVDKDLESEEVQNHQVFAHWDWNEWNELVSDLDKWSTIENAACGCSEVQDEYARLQSALDILRNFSDFINEHYEELYFG